MPNRRKTPKRGGQALPEKEPRSRAVSTQGDYPRWSFTRIDWNGPWCPKALGAHKLLEVVNKLTQFEGRTWGDIESDRRNHAVETASVGKAAQARLVEIRQDDVASLFSLRLSGRERVWGIREGALFRLLWWDPEHSVYPSKKKHT